MKEALMRMDDTEWIILGLFFVAAFVGLIFLIKGAIKSLRESSKKADNIWRKITSEKGLTILGWILTLVGVAGIIVGFGLMMNSAKAFGMQESTYGLILAGGLFGGVFVGVLGIAILCRHTSSSSKVPRSTQNLHAKLEHIQTMPPAIQADLLKKATTEYSADVRNELQAERTKKAIIKGAVVGGVVGGDAGAVVGAMIGKEKAADPTTGNSTAKSMAKWAVVGGIVAGKAGAVVGAALAKEKAKE